LERLRCWGALAGDSRGGKKMVARILVLMLCMSCDRTGIWDGAGRLAGEDCDPGEISELTPADGHNIVPVGASVSFMVGEGASDGAVELWVDRGTTDGWQTMSPDDDGMALFLPAAPFEPLTLYTARVEVCGEPAAESMFRTLGPPVGGEVIGRTYEYDLLNPDLVWIEPRTTPPALILEKMFDVTTLILIQLQAEKDAKLDIAVSLGEDDLGTTVQHTCVAPTLLTVDFVDNPYFSIGPERIVMADGDEPFVLEKVEFTGYLQTDGSAILSLYMSAVVDVRQIKSNEQVDICGLLSRVGTCEPCADQDPDAEEPQCLLVKAINPRAPWVPDLVIDPDPVRADEC
jgi:hypothetical protein